MFNFQCVIIVIIIIIIIIIISLLTYTKQIAIYKLKVHKRTIKSYLQFISIIIIIIIIMRTLFLGRKLHCFHNLKKSLIYNSNKKITLKAMIYKYKLEIQIMKEY